MLLLNREGDEPAHHVAFEKILLSSYEGFYPYISYISSFIAFKLVRNFPFSEFGKPKVSLTEVFTEGKFP